MPPGQGRALHLAQRANSGYAPAGQLGCQSSDFLRRSGQADGRNLAVDSVCVTESLSEIFDFFDVNKTVQTRGLKAGVLLIDDCPSGGFRALPESCFIGIFALRRANFVE